jgi:hypothetical protein
MLYPGEIFYNLADERLWIGSVPNPIEIILTGGTNVNFTGGTFNEATDTLTLTDRYNVSISIMYQCQ